MKADATLTRVLFESTGEKCQTELEVTILPNFLPRLDNWIKDKCGDIIKREIYQGCENGLTRVIYTVSGPQVWAHVGLPLLINQSLETPTLREEIVKLLETPTVKTLPSIFQLMDLNMPTPLSEKTSLLSQQFWTAMKKDQASTVLTGIGLLYVQPPFMTLPVSPASSVQSQTEKQLSDSQPMEVGSARLIRFWISYCRECFGTNIQITVWIDPNNNDRVIDGDPPNDDCWCESCEQNNDWDTIDVNATDRSDALARIVPILRQMQEEENPPSESNGETSEN